MDLSAVEKTERVAGCLGGYAFCFASEEDLSRGVELVMIETGCVFAKELILAKDARIDFLTEGKFAGVGVELKVAGSATAVIRQLARYAEFDAVCGLVLVTTRSSHRSIPPSLGGKPVRVVYVGGVF
jgi:hypothetical protein